MNITIISISITQAITSISITSSGNLYNILIKYKYYY